jgi:hypothetical protein
MRLHSVKFLIWIKHPMGIAASPISLLAGVSIARGRHADHALLQGQ